MPTEEAGLFAAARRQRILEFIEKEGAISVPRLASALGASHSSIRRDLARLDREGRLRRTHGGAEALPNNGFWPLAFSEKLGRHREAKRRIAREAVLRIREGETVCLDGGTTTQAIAECLPAFEKLTVVTNSIQILIALAPHAHLQILTIGGALQHGTLAMVGSLTAELLGRIHVDTLFLGADGITEDGVTTATEMEAFTKIRMMEASRRVIAVADSEKMGRRAPFRVASLEEIHEVITDDSIDDGTRALIGNAPVRLTIV